MRRFCPKGTWTGPVVSESKQLPAKMMVVTICTNQNFFISLFPGKSAPKIFLDEMFLPGSRDPAQCGGTVDPECCCLKRKPDDLERRESSTTDSTIAASLVCPAMHPCW